MNGFKPVRSPQGLKHLLRDRVTGEEPYQPLRSSLKVQNLAKKHNVQSLHGSYISSASPEPETSSMVYNGSRKYSQHRILAGESTSPVPSLNIMKAESSKKLFNEKFSLPNIHVSHSQENLHMPRSPRSQKHDDFMNIKTPSPTPSYLYYSQADSKQEHRNLPPGSVSPVASFSLDRPSKRNSRSPSSSPRRLDAKSSELYLLNRKKYMPKLEPISNPSSPSKNVKEEIFNLHRIKEELKIKRRNLKVPTHNMINLQRMKNIQELNKEMQKATISREDEVKIGVLRRKIAINTMFGLELNENSTIEERKGIFKNLLLEYHPDKKKHDKEITQEIFNFLQVNKTLFIEGGIAI